MSDKIVGLIKQTDARLLREALANLARYSPQSKAYVIEVLKRFAAQVASYCVCVDQAEMGFGVRRCLDCGANWILEGENYIKQKEQKT